MKTARVNKPLRVISSIEELPVMCTVEEAGLLLRQSPETIYKLVASGALHGAKIGRTWCFRRSDLQSYIDHLFESPRKEP